MVIKRSLISLSISLVVFSANLVHAQSVDLNPSTKFKTSTETKHKSKKKKSRIKCSGSCKSVAAIENNAARRRPPTATPTPRVRIPTPRPGPKCTPPQLAVCEGGICDCFGGVPTPITIGPSSCPSGYNLHCSRTPLGTTYCSCMPNQAPTPAPQPQAPTPVPPPPTPVCKTGERIICDGRTPCRCESIFPTPLPTPLQCRTGERKVCDGLTPCRCETIFPTPLPTPLQCRTGERKVCDGRTPCRCESIFPTPQPPLSNENCTNSVLDAEYFLDLARTFTTRSLSCIRKTLPLFTDQTKDVIPVVGKWSGSQAHSIGFFANNTQNGLWSIDSNGDGVLEPGLPFGVATDIPIVGDWNNDGKDDFGTVRGEEWFLDKDGSRSWTPANDIGIIPFQGHCGVPLAGDLNGDGLTDLVLFNDGKWLIKFNQGELRFSEMHVAHFGQAGDFPVIGDLDGDGRQELIVKRISNWYVDSNSNLSWDASDTAFVNFGEAIDVPLVGTWNARDVRASIGVYRAVYGLSGVPKSTCFGR